MNIRLKEFTIREITTGYVDKKEDGVYGLSGNLNIRPPYQREYVYKDKQRDEVIKTIRRGFPLNSIYWALNDDGTLHIPGRGSLMQKYVSAKQAVPLIKLLRIILTAHPFGRHFLKQH